MTSEPRPGDGERAAALAALPGAPAAGERRAVILDCDPGHDDALAIALACASPGLDVLGVTTVAGNAPLELTTRNARRVLALLGREDVPVAAGADRPLVREPWTPSHVHGASGLDGADLPEPAVALRPEAAIELQVALILGAPAPVTLVPTGPLTNIALLLRAFPAIHARIAAISLMGGALGVGNTTASAEFNIWHDPEAAAIVFESGIPILMAGLDITHQALVLPEDVERLAALGTRTGRVFADLMRFFGRHHAERYGWAGPPVHDAVAVAVLVAPWLIERRSLFVAVETGDGLTRGRTVGDERGVAGRAPNAEVLVALDRPAFIDLVIEAVSRFA
ncbi:MAG TPA: nucleoside hydrolase [Candidatus Limnocylindrales bacterium]|nr:nucleoside hydrolase [Candidatus Limnocylindrales bacterium]